MQSTAATSATEASASPPSVSPTKAFLGGMAVALLGATAIGAGVWFWLRHHHKRSSASSSSSSSLLRARPLPPLPPPPVVVVVPYPLHAAAFDGDVEALRRLVLSSDGNEAGAKLDVNAAVPGTPLFVAAQQGQAEAVSLLLSVADIQVDAPHRASGQTPLYVASLHGHAAVVRVLLEEGGADPNLPVVQDGTTALFVACQEGHADVVAILLEEKYGVDLNRATRMGGTSLFIASQEGHHQVVSLLLSHGRQLDLHARTLTGSSALSVASANGHHDIVSSLLQAESEFNLRATALNGMARDGTTPLFLACEGGHLGVVRLLLRHQHSPPQQDIEQDKKQEEEESDEEGEEDGRVKLNTRRFSDWMTPLLVAVEQGHDAVVHELLCSSASAPPSPEPSTTNEDANGRVISNGLQLDLFLEAKREDGFGALSLAASQGSALVVDWLLQCGANPNSEVSEGVTPLYLAASNGHISVVKLLLAHSGVMVDTATPDGSTPLSAAAQAGHGDAVRELMKAGALPPSLPPPVRQCRDHVTS